MPSSPKSTKFSTLLVVLVVAACTPLLMVVVVESILDGDKTMWSRNGFLVKVFFRLPQIFNLFVFSFLI